MRLEHSWIDTNRADIMGLEHSWTREWTSWRGKERRARQSRDEPPCSQCVRLTVQLFPGINAVTDCKIRTSTA